MEGSAGRRIFLTTLPADVGTAAAGTGTEAARDDHVHGGGGRSQRRTADWTETGYFRRRVHREQARSERLKADLAESHVHGRCDRSNAHGGYTCCNERVCR